MGELGLERWGVRHGLVVKLEMRSLDAVLPANWVQGSDDHGGVWYDIDRSLELYENVYEFRGIRERAIWSDRSTLNIPWQYFAMALQLADVARVAGRGVGAASGGRLAQLPDRGAGRSARDANPVGS